jgi:ABC-type multidrug transport system permease subunit
VEKALGAAAMVVVGISLLGAWSLYSFVDTSAYHIGVRIFAYRLAASMYALQALFFQYGELRDQNDLTVT